ncbi:Ank2 [Symbiodinium pilosum]|uniref:Ank2 protein n=1 Tax=Symbiodinium pilosum TaxID=2952 RepID=A0A812QQ79_SYMPI|nr:Ank2 [Symbiodinium pilosum]
MVLVTITMGPSGRQMFSGDMDQQSRVQDLKQLVLPNVATEKMTLLHGGNMMEDSSVLGSYLTEPHAMALELTLTLRRVSIYADLDGAWFGDQRYIPAVHEAGRTVHLLDGVCWFELCGTFRGMEGGNWSIFLRVKRKHRIYFDTDVIVSLNGSETKTFVPGVLSSLPEEQWTLLDLGAFQGSGSLKVELKGADCSNHGQHSKSGLYIDQLLAEPC